MYESSLGCVKKWGVRTKMSFGSRFMGGMIDSSKRKFGRTFASNELLTAVIYTCSREFGIAMKVPGGRLSLTHLCDRHVTVLVISSHPIPVSSPSVAFCGHGRHILDVVDVFIQLAFQQAEELRHGVGAVQVDHDYLLWRGRLGRRRGEGFRNSLVVLREEQGKNPL